jgi:prepilin-type N-terminal cleavage/methylation domain-containing protein
MINSSSKGFTLIETLLAVGILATAIAGPLTIASKGLSTALVAKDQTTAFYLAQDAVEYVRFARDSNRLQSGDWLTGSGGSGVPFDLSNCAFASGCYLDSIDDVSRPPTQCGATCPSLNYDTANHFFTYNTLSGTVVRSPFTRTINLNVSSDNKEASLTVRVTWKDSPGITHTISVREELLNWQ